jgi:hypothetical protein
MPLSNESLEALTLEALELEGVAIRLRKAHDKLVDMMREGARLEKDKAPHVVQRQMRNETMLQRRLVNQLVAEYQTAQQAHTIMRAHNNVG